MLVGGTGRRRRPEKIGRWHPVTAVPKSLVGWTGCLGEGGRFTPATELDAVLASTVVEHFSEGSN